LSTQVDAEARVQSSLLTQPTQLPLWTSQTGVAGKSAHCSSSLQPSATLASMLGPGVIPFAPPLEIAVEPASLPSKAG
jgi:hypothetical protein